MANTLSGPQIPFVDNPGAPEIFADGAKGVFLLNGNIHITFTSRRSDYSSEPGALYETVAGRIVLPLATAEIMAAELGKFIEKMKAQRQRASLSGAQTLQ